MIAPSISTIYAEATPNPETMKFVSNKLIIKQNIIVEYHSFDETNGAPLAQMLFATNKIKSLFFNNNFITVTKNVDYNWSSLMPELRDLIKGFLNNSADAILDYPVPMKEEKKEEKTTAPTAVNQSEIESAIINILEEYIKPAVEQDGGAITFRSYHEGVVTVALQGSCSGCPSSTVTLKSGIENLLKKMVPGVNEVVAENA